MVENITEVYQFRPNPGPRERHLKRQHRNPLFRDRDVVTQKEVNEARQADLDELQSFSEALKQLVKEAVELPPNAESDVILGMKERADRLYEQAAGLGGELSAEINGIRKLTAVIMDAVRKGAGVDPTALSELDQETQARAAHYELLEHPLVADLLSPESPIEREHLVPSLLSAGRDELAAAMRLFDPEQSRELVAGARALMQSLSEVDRTETRQAALAIMEANTVADN